MAEAGYKLGASGMWEKDGAPFRPVLIFPPSDRYVKTAQILQQQAKTAGWDIELKQTESAVLYKVMADGDYNFGVIGMGYDEADLMYFLFHSSQIGGGLNWVQVKDAELDKMLDSSRSEIDPAKRQLLLNDIQKRIVEQAYTVPLNIGKIFAPISTRIKGAIFNQYVLQLIDYHDAYIETE
jgi:peptide/nickel transport system substrate-binding protein